MRLKERRTLRVIHTRKCREEKPDGRGSAPLVRSMIVGRFSGFATVAVPDNVLFGFPVNQSRKMESGPKILTGVLQALK